MFNIEFEINIGSKIGPPLSASTTNQKDSLLRLQSLSNAIRYNEFQIKLVLVDYENTKCVYTKRIHY